MKNEMSIVITTWNNKQILRDCLKSLEKQSVKPSEVIVVDNCSKDGTVKMVKSEFPHVKMVAMPNSNHGACETLNIGFKLAKNKYVAVIDDDVILPRDWISNMLSRFGKEPETTGAISTKVIEPGMPKSEKKERKPFYRKSGFHGCGTVFLRKALYKAGLYPEEYFIYVNETNLSAKLMNADYEILQYDKVKTYHKKQYGIRMGTRSIYFHTRNTLWLHFEFLSLKNAFLHTGFYLFYMFFKAFRESTLRAFFRGILSAIPRTPHYLMNRRYCKKMDSEYDDIKLGNVHKFLKNHVR